MQIGAAQRELSRSNDERFLAPGYGCIPHAEWLSRYSTTVLHNRARCCNLVQARGRLVVAWEDQREHDYGWGVFRALFG